MIEKARISPLQMALIMHPTILVTTSITVSSITMRVAGTDMWMTPILSSLVGLLTIYIVFQLHTRFPSDTFVQYLPRICGRYVGTILAFAYVLTLLYAVSLTLREYSEFISTNFLSETPMIMVVIPITAVCAYALYAGLEVIARTSQLFIPAAMLIIIAMVLIMIPDLQHKHIRPILEYGPLPPLLGSIAPASWYSQFFFLSFLIPNLSKKELGMKWSLFSLLAVMFTMVTINLAILFTFGTLTTAMNYPFLVAIRYITLSDFVEHLESILMAVSLMGIFIKIAFVYYLATLGTAQMLKLSDYRPLIIPIGFLIVLVSMWAAPSAQELNHSLNTTIPFFTLLMHVVIPALLLLTVIVKSRLQR